jgi:hypothetical protein
MDYTLAELNKRFFSKVDGRDPSNEIEYFKIPQKWRKFLVDTYKEQANSVEEPEDISKITQKWRWTISNQRDSILMTIRLLHLKEAATVRRLVDEYINQTDINIFDMEEAEETRLYNKMGKLFYRALKILYDCNLVKTISLDRETVGSGKRAVSIWVSPFAKKKQIDKEKHLYLVMGGAFGTGKKKKMSEDEYDELMRERMAKTKKRHADRFRKINKITFECTNCGIKVYVSKNDELELIAYDSAKKCTCRKGRFKRVEKPRTKRRPT